MFTNSDRIRENIKELSAELLEASNNRDWERCDEIDLEIEDLTRELQLIERSHYYSVEKL